MGNAQSNPQGCPAQPSAGKRGAQGADLLGRLRRGLPSLPSLKRPRRDPRSEIERKRVALTIAKNNLKKQQEEFDKLVPDELTQKKTREAEHEFAIYKETKLLQYQVEKKLFDQTLEQLKVALENPVREIAKKYDHKIKNTAEKLYNEYEDNKEKSLMERRRFLDADPQEGVSGIGWFQSVDQQVLIVFWVTYVLFISTFIVLLLQAYGLQYLVTKNNMIITGALTFICLVLLAHTFLSNFVSN
jgi:hypothetical protein